MWDKRRQWPVSLATDSVQIMGRLSSFCLVGILPGLVAVLTGCSSTEATTEPKTSLGCTPGASTACVGPSQCAGYQVCRPDGLALGECLCGIDGGHDVSVDSEPDSQKDSSIELSLEAPADDVSSEPETTQEAESGAAVDSDASDEMDGPCSPPAVLCSGVCSNTSVDSLNCGACGHDCNGGECVGGACQPVVIVSGLTSTVSIAVDSHHVYWTTGMHGQPDGGLAGGMVSRVLKTGGTVETLASGLTAPNYLAVDGGLAYWTTYGTYPGSIMGVPVNGGPATVLCTPSEPIDSDRLAIGSGSVFWNNGSHNQIWFCPIGGGVSSKLTPVQIGVAPRAIAVDDQMIYWTNGISDTLMACPHSGCVVTSGYPKILANYTSSCIGQEWLAVDDVYACWTSPCSGSGSSGALMRAPKTGGAVELLADNQESPVGVVVDPTHIYWATGDHRVMRIVKQSLTKEVFAVDQSASPHGLVLDDEHVYWISDDRIVRLVK